MKVFFKVIAICFLVVLVMSSVYSQEKAPLTNADIVRMVKEKISPDLIIRVIESSKNQFDTSIEAVIKLKKEGVSEEIIKAMLNAKKTDSPRVETFATQIEKPAKLVVNGFTLEQVFFRTDQAGLRYLGGRLLIGDRKLKKIDITIDLLDASNNIIKTEKTSWAPPAAEEDGYINNYWDFRVIASYQGVTKYLIREVVVQDFYGYNVTLIEIVKRITIKKCPFKKAYKKERLFRGKNLYIMIDGDHSFTRIKNPNPYFEIYVPADKKPSEFVTFVSLDIKSKTGRREIRLTETEKGYVIPDPDKLPLVFEKIGQEHGIYIIYRVRLTKPLDVGEYVILLGDSLAFDFGLDEPR